jgi:DNA-binding CsgD family transcriptional regulator
MFFPETTIKIENRKTTFVGRELALLHLLGTGSTPKSIAEGADVPVQTVYSQLRSVLIKLRVRSYEKAVKKAKRLGLLGNIS